MQQQQLRRIDPDSSSILGSGADDTRLQYISDTSNYDSTSNNSNPSPSSVLDRYFDIMTSPPPPPPLHSVQQSPKNDQVASVLSASENDLSRPVSTNSIIGAYGNILSPPSRPTSNRSFGAVLDDGKQQPSRLSQTAIDNKPQSPIAPSIAKPKPPVPQRPLRIPSHLGSSNTINSNTQETSNSGDYSPSAISFYTGGDNNRASNISRQQYSTSNVVTSDADAVKISSYYNASNGALEDSPLGTPTNDEIDYTKSATKEYEEERQAELDYRKQVKQRQSVIIKYEHATLEDFEGDMQNLVEDLEKIMKGFGTVAAVSATPIAPNVTEQNQSSKSSYESLNDTRILGDSTNVLESIDNVQQVTSVVSVSEEKRSKRPPPPPPPSNPPPARRTSSRRSAKSNNTETINDLQAPQMSQTTHPFILQQMQSHQLPSQTPVAREDAVPLGQLYGTANIVNTSNSDNVAPSLVESNSIQQTLSKLAADPTNIKKLTVQVYVNDHNVSRPMVVNSLTTSHQLVQDAKRQRLLTEDGDADDWTLFEAVDELGIERPLRDFELVMEVIETWGQESSNILLLKRYAYRQSLTLESAKEGQSSRMAGWLYVETKPGRWNNRYCQLNSNGIFYSKDQKVSH